MEWYERRAIFNNLKENSAMNVLTSQDVESIWLPLITYTNTDQEETTRLGLQNEWSTHVKVRREGNLTRGGMEVVDEVEGEALVQSDDGGDVASLLLLNDTVIEGGEDSVWRVVGMAARKVVRD